MKRTTIWLTDAQVAAIARMAKKTGLKQAELIRRLIDVGLNQAFEPPHERFKQSEPLQRFVDRKLGRRQRKAEQ